MAALMAGHTPLSGPDKDTTIWAMEFATHGGFIVSGGTHAVRLWRTMDGHEMARMAAASVNCVAVSRDHCRIAAGTFHGELWLWDANTYDEICLRWENTGSVNGVDFSPDSTRLSFASQRYGLCVVSTLKAATGHWQNDPALYHDDCNMVIVVKYSPHGDRIATATCRSVRLYDSNDGQLLFNLPVVVTPWYNTGLAWSKNHIFLVSDNNIKQIDACTGLTTSEWPVSDANYSSCIVLSHHGDLIAYSTDRTITFWDTSTKTQLGCIHHTRNIRSITLTPDDRSIAIGGEGGIISMKRLSSIIEPDIQIDNATLHLWECNQLANAEASLTTVITNSQIPNHHLHACRALIRARLGKWDTAINDVKEDSYFVFPCTTLTLTLIYTKSFEIHSSIFGYIAKSITLVGQGKKLEGYRACDVAFEFTNSTHVGFLLLFKAIITFIAGDHDDAIARVDDLISTISLNSVCHMVQKYMQLLLGVSLLENNNYEQAIHSFECALAKVSRSAGRTLKVISLISGWKFGALDITIQHHLCEALFMAGRRTDAIKSFLKMVDVYAEEVTQMESMTNWVSDFMHKCLSTADNSGDFHITSDSMIFQQLARVWAKATLESRSWNDALDIAVNFLVPRSTIYRIICQRLRAIDRIADAISCLQQMVIELGNETQMDVAHTEWFAGFKRRCIQSLRRLGDAAMSAERYEEATTHYSAALSLNPVAPQDIYVLRSNAYVAMGSWEDAIEDAAQVMALDPSSTWNYKTTLMEWAKAEFTDGLQWKNALTVAAAFKVPRHTVYEAMCEYLETLGQIMDATDCFHEMERELPRVIAGEGGKWVHSENKNFKSRCSWRLEELGDTVMNAQQYEEAISHYSVALSLSPTSTLALFTKRSKAYSAKAMWKEALADSNRAIALDPSSPFGYERKCAVLRGAGRYKDMSDAYHTMILKMLHSSDPAVRERYRQYTKTKETIRKAIQDVIRDLPRVLINTTSGRLCNRSEQMTAFERLPIFMELVSSMTTKIDHKRIRQEVTDFYRYATFSHKWEDHEPLFDKVIHVVVYDLDESPTHDKLQMFCKIVQEAGFHWAWSDTCCINKADHFVLQEALVAMFKWYRGSALTVIFLRGVRSPAKRGDLVGSIWNSRAWTLQEYHASKVVQFYTEDWKPYMNLNIPNHKDSPLIISEMEEATGVSSRVLMGLQPGTNDVREKLCLASRRETTFIEDAAYSLLGIFSVSLPVVYGEGDRSLGRLLAQLLASSGNTNILAWTGKSGTFNSFLPADIAVFSQLPTAHIPPVNEQAKMETTAARLYALSFDRALMVTLYDKLNELPVPSFAGRRMKLPCITFKLGPLAISRDKSEYVFRAQATALGVVVIRTVENLSRSGSLYLIHPWIDFLLDRQPVRSMMQTIAEEGVDHHSSLTGNSPSFLRHSNATLEGAQAPAAAPPADRDPVRSISQPYRYSTTSSLFPPSSVSSTETEMRALRLIARLKQPFGALLLTPDTGNVAAYSRVAARSLITVQLEDITPAILNRVVDNVRVLDVL